MPLSHSPGSIRELNELSKKRKSKEMLDAEIESLKKRGFSGEQIDLYMYRKHGIPKTYRARREKLKASALEPM